MGFIEAKEAVPIIDRIRALEDRLIDHEKRIAMLESHFEKEGLLGKLNPFKKDKGE